MKAIKGNNVLVVNEYLAADGNPCDRLCNLQERTAIQLAAMYSGTEIVARLASYPKVDINQRTPEGYTPVMLAADFENLPALTALLAISSIDVFAKDYAGKNALEHALTKRNAAVVAPLVTRSTMAGPGQVMDPRTLLLAACLVSDADAVRQFLSRSDIDASSATDSKGWTAFQLALQAGSIPILKLFVSRKDINVNALSPNGGNILTLAVAQNDKSFVTDLLAVPSLDANVTTTEGNTALHIASARFDAEMVKLLVRHPGIKAEGVNFRNETPLRSAIAGETPVQLADGLQVVKALRQSGVDCGINAKDANNNTALVHAIATNRQEIAAELLAFPRIDVNIPQAADQLTPLRLAAKKNALPLFKMLLSRAEINIGATQSSGFNVLTDSIECYSNSPAYLQALLECESCPLYQRYLQISESIDSNGMPPVSHS
jgi:ankyrin repeat protein